MASIQKDKRTGKWFCRISYKDNNGKYKTKTKKGYATKKEAEIVANELELSVSRGVDLDRDQIIFADYFEEWVQTYKMPNLSISTVKKYEFIIKLVHRYFEDLKLKDLTKTRYQKFITDRGKNRGRDAVEKTHYAIKSCLKDALYDKLIERDPTYRATLTWDNKTDTKLKHWNVAEVAKLINYFESNERPADMLFYLLATTGLRIGEAYGLSWDDIKNNRLSVKRGYNHSYKQFTSAKNRASIRTIELDEKTKSLLKHYRIKNRKKAPDYLFLDRFEQPIITHAGATKYLKEVCVKLDVQVLTGHAFRHSHCSYLLYSGVDIHYISKRLGHSSIMETQKTYSHILDEMDKKEKNLTLKAIDRLAGGAK